MAMRATAIAAHLVSLSYSRATSDAPRPIRGDAIISPSPAYMASCQSASRPITRAASPAHMLARIAFAVHLLRILLIGSPLPAAV
jgi:hypothetical protein